jgi:hypothetical protein
MTPLLETVPVMTLRASAITCGTYQTAATTQQPAISAPPTAWGQVRRLIRRARRPPGADSAGRDIAGDAAGARSGI